MDELTDPGQRQGLLAWSSGKRGYTWAILTFYKSVPAARSAFTKYGGDERLRNVVANWDHRPETLQLRQVFLGCLRTQAHGGSTRPTPRASLATFAGMWTGHTRGLRISQSGIGHEEASVGCCTPAYRLTLRILSVRGTLTRAAATYRVTSFRRYFHNIKPLHAGEVGELELRNGVVRNKLTRDYFCSGPAAFVCGG